MAGNLPDPTFYAEIRGAGDVLARVDERLGYDIRCGNAYRAADLRRLADEFAAEDQRYAASRDRIRTAITTAATPDQVVANLRGLGVDFTNAEV